MTYDKNIIAYRTDKEEAKEKPKLGSVGWFDKVGGE